MKNAASHLAMFLQRKTGTVCGTWSGSMTEAEQRELFGAFVGQEAIRIDGARETIQAENPGPSTGSFTFFQLDQD